MESLAKLFRYNFSNGVFMDYGITGKHLTIAIQLARMRQSIYLGLSYAQSK